MHCMQNFILSLKSGSSTFNLVNNLQTSSNISGWFFLNILSKKIISIASSSLKSSSLSIRFLIAFSFSSPSNSGNEIIIGFKILVSLMFSSFKHLSRGSVVVITEITLVLLIHSIFVEYLIILERVFLFTLELSSSILMYWGTFRSITT